ncbi:two-CW domain-containing protein [Thiovibrio sp. JS02]
MKKNCWEVKGCGRMPGGAMVKERGECPAVKCFPAHGIHDGINGGRACWAISGTFCDGAVQGSFAEKIGGCASCDFYKLVIRQEGKSIKSTYEILERIGSKR